ncbi:MAG: hypothetical protein Q9186_001996 [Xanthomendoza sp. 1 TL-2023]
MPLADQPTPRQRFFKGTLNILASIAIIAIAITAICILHNPRLSHLQQPSAPIPIIPKDFRTVGLVFYGRRSRVEILNCYLKQNLKRNGGLLDEVIFLARTDNVEDLAYLDQIVAETTGYSRHNVTNHNTRASKVTYGQAWEVAERGTMYIKIDDDIMFIEKNAIASLIATKIAHPEHLLVSTNTINSPRLAWLHSHLGAIHPYLPEPSPPSTPNPENENENLNWRPSALPPWPGNPETFSLPRHPHRPSLPHNQPQRWLPVPYPYNTSLTGTPASLLTYDSSTEGLRNWAIATQQHYSFLQNLERHQLHLYSPSPSPSSSSSLNSAQWKMQKTRIQINLIAIFGDDIIDNLPIPPDDEEYLTVILPERLGREAVVDLGAVAVHFAFRHQRRGVEGTDLLGRYRGLAGEYCAK